MYLQFTYLFFNIYVYIYIYVFIYLYFDSSSIPINYLYKSLSGFSWILDSLFIQIRFNLDSNTLPFWCPYGVGVAFYVDPVRCLMSIWIPYGFSCIQYGLLNDPIRIYLAPFRLAYWSPVECLYSMESNGFPIVSSSRLQSI
mgnify:CR=1 FL=1